MVCKSSREIQKIESSVRVSSSSECVIRDFHKGGRRSESTAKWFKQPMIRRIRLKAPAFSGRGEDGELGEVRG